MSYNRPHFRPNQEDSGSLNDKYITRGIIFEVYSHVKDIVCNNIATERRFTLPVAEYPNDLNEIYILKSDKDKNNTKKAGYIKDLVRMYRGYMGFLKDENKITGAQYEEIEAKFRPIVSIGRVADNKDPIKSLQEIHAELTKMSNDMGNKTKNYWISVFAENLSGQVYFQSYKNSVGIYLNDILKGSTKQSAIGFVCNNFDKFLEISKLKHGLNALDSILKLIQEVFILWSNDGSDDYTEKQGEMNEAIEAYIKTKSNTSKKKTPNQNNSKNKTTSSNQSEPGNQDNTKQRGKRGSSDHSSPFIRKFRDDLYPPNPDPDPDSDPDSDSDSDPDSEPEPESESESESESDFDSEQDTDKDGYKSPDIITYYRVQNNSIVRPGGIEMFRDDEILTLEILALRYQLRRSLYFHLYHAGYSRDGIFQTKKKYKMEEIILIFAHEETLQYISAPPVKKSELYYTVYSLNPEEENKYFYNTDSINCAYVTIKAESRYTYYIVYATRDIEQNELLFRNTGKREIIIREPRKIPNPPGLEDELNNAANQDLTAGDQMIIVQMKLQMKDS